MDCLHDYIGIRICESIDNIPDSGVYINTLPGISLQSIDASANDDQVTYARVWEDVQREAAVRFEIDVIEELNECYSLNPYCDYGNLICDNKNRFTSAWKYLLGNQLMLFRIYSTRLNRFTMVDLAQAEKLKDFYQVEYEKSLSQSVKLIDVTDCELCCEGNPNTVIWLP